MDLLGFAILLLLFLLLFAFGYLLAKAIFQTPESRADERVRQIQARYDISVDRMRNIVRDAHNKVEETAGRRKRGEEKLGDHLGGTWSDL